MAPQRDTGEVSGLDAPSTKAVIFEVGAGLALATFWARRRAEKGKLR